MKRTDRPADADGTQGDIIRAAIGPFADAAEATLLATILTDATDPGNPIVFANDAFLALSGFDAADTLAKPLDRFFASVTDTGTISSFRAALVEGRSASCETQCRRADGREFLAAVFVTPVPARDGTPPLNAISIIELGGHVERLLDQRNEFHALYELAPGFIATSEGPDHRITFANASFKKFVGRERLVGLTVAQTQPEIVEQGFIALLDHVFATGEPFVGTGIEMRLCDPAGGAPHIRHCNFVYQAVRDADERITGLFCEGYDVTEQHRTAAALAELQDDLIHVSRVNAMGTMATTLAHELNQPLSAIGNYTAGARRLIEGGASNDLRLSGALQGIEEASQRAADIIRNLRELTRRRDSARSRFALGLAVAECVRLIRATAPPGIDIVEAIGEDMMMTADRVQIQQVIINLLRNACDAVADGARRQIIITAIEQEEALIVSVRDSGPGVPLEAARQIFSWSDTAKEGGMGLGLSICQTIMEAHRGRIWLDGCGPDGTDFRFSVPVDAAAALDAPDR